MSESAGSIHLTPYTPRTLRTWAGSLPGHSTMEGTLVYADVSGFTRLTERLARQGKQGAEEMVTTISEVWEALLASDDGGDVLKFAGDALLLFYEGDGHASRACQRALAMQRELDRVGRIERAGGVVRLRMSIGINSGRFHFFAVGDNHVDLLVLGEAATQTIDLEAAAAAGQVLISDETARLAIGARLGKRVGPGHLLRSVPTCPPAVPSPATTAHPPERFVAPSLRDRLGQTEHEHRWAAVAFAQLGNVDSMLAGKGVQETFALVQHFTTVVMGLLEEYGILLTSCDLARDGAGLMMTAGVPDANGDDANRMLRAALRIVTTDPGLPVRVGVNAGNVFVGDVGPPFRRTFATMGDTTNLAARVTARAPWGAALATRFVLEPADGFVTTALEPFTVKGKRRPVEASRVEGISEGTVPPAPTGPLVGRENELATLHRALAEVRTGTGRVVEIVGEEGSGKSRLVSEARRNATDLPWVTVACDPFERTSTYHTARILLRRVFDISEAATQNEAGDRLKQVVDRAAPGLRPWLPLLAVPFEASVAATPETDEVAERYRRVRTQQVVSELVEAWVRQPLAMVVEDAADMDDASAELIAGVLSRASENPWLAVVTRTHETGGLHLGRGYDAEVVTLEPLADAHAVELAEKLAETTPVPQHLIPEMVARAGGNPLFLSELIAGVEGDMPHTVEGIVAARIDGLAPQDRQALRYLSVLGDHFQQWILTETLSDLDVSPDDHQLWDRLSAYVRREGDRYSFVNPLVRQVAYEGLSYAWRREIHSRVADSMRRQDSNAVAIHLSRAERWEEAWQVARSAGDKARRAAANAVAAELYELALEAAGHVDVPPAERAEVAALAGMSWSRAGVPDRALEAYGLAIAATEDEAERLLLAARRAGVHENAGRFPQALGLYARAITEAEQIDHPDARRRLLAVLHSGYASTRHRQGRLVEAMEHAQTAVGHAEAVGDRETLAYLYHLLDRAHTAANDREMALRYRDAALPLFAELGDLAAQGTVLHDLAADAHRGGRLEEATWLYERAIDARTRAGDVVRAAASVNALGEVELSLGWMEQAERRFGEALRTWRGARSPEGIVVAATNLAAVALQRDDPETALGRLEEAAHRAAEIGAEHLLPAARLLQARAYARLDRWVEVWESATLALHHAAETSQGVEAHELRAEALTATGGKERAEQELTEARALADQRANGPVASTGRDG